MSDDIVDRARYQWSALDTVARHHLKDQMADEIERLRRWRSEAIEVLSGWELVFEAVEHRSADIGRSKSDVVLEHIAVKNAEIERLRGDIALIGMANARLWALIEDSDQ